jgi:hypothetical protein
MKRQRMTRHSCSYTAPKTSTNEDTLIITDYERGTRYAGYMFVAMFVFLAIGCVMFGW